MNAITLYIEDLNTLIKDLHPLHRERLLAALPAQLDNIKLRDALNLISYETYWVSKYRDLSDVKPLSVDSDYFAYDRQAMQPLLDALEKGDFELAEALTPAKYRLCGYQEYTEAKTEESAISAGPVSSQTLLCRPVFTPFSPASSSTTRQSIATPTGFGIIPVSSPG